MSQFLDTSQHLVAAHLNAQHAVLADQLSVADANQFVTVVQQQQQQHLQQQQQSHHHHNTNHQLHDVAFFHQQQHHQNQPVASATTAASSSLATTMTTTNQHQAHCQPHINHHPQSFNQLNSHPQHQLNSTVTNNSFDHQQQLCVNMVNGNIDFASANVIFNQGNGIFRIPQPILNQSNQVAFAINGLKHQQQNHQTFSALAVCDNNVGDNLGTANNTNNNNTGANNNINNNNNNNNNGSHGSRASRPNEGGPKRSSSNAEADVSAYSTSSNRNTSKPSNTSANNTNAAGKAINSANGNGKSSKTKGANKKSEKSNGQTRNSESPRRTFACPTCGKGFTEKFNMKRHMQIHSQSRPKYICEECSKSFAWKDNFIRHKKASHTTNLQSFPI